MRVSQAGLKNSLVPQFHTSSIHYSHSWNLLGSRATYLRAFTKHRIYYFVLVKDDSSSHLPLEPTLLAFQSLP